MNLLIEVLAFAVAIGVLVVVHEYGHYSVARLCGVKVLRFSIGFGKPLFQWVSPKSGTEWTVAALPLGGYVKMLDERETGGAPIPADALPHAFNRQSVWRRIAIVAAGPVANFLLAILLFSLVFATGVTEPAAILAAPAPNTAAAVAGFEGGETVVGVRAENAAEAEPVRSWSDLRWKLLGAAFDHKRVVLSAKGADGTSDFQLDLRGLTEKDVDDNFMSRLGFEPGGGKLTVAGVQPGSAAQKAGLLPGDRLRGINGMATDNATAFIAYVKSHAGQPLTLQVERAGAGQGQTQGQTQAQSQQAGRLEDIRIVPQAQRDAATGELVGRIGAELATQVPSIDVRYGPLESLRLGAHRTWDLAVYSVRMFGRMIVGEASLKNLSGPVTIADYAGKSARLGPSAFLSFLALVSISLGVLNLLPIPVLDGGHLLYYSVEAVTGKVVSDRWQLVFQRAGLACIVALSAIALFNDLARLIHF
ncbi:RIP metalloprotease RseP [bacterium M00.F.Ca.ET.228.01.1.1]|uniref:RIP metalloprotease RseP n=1 Tax=Paraburkholderia phenoliruptrix TaxID=252970 RepID=UPI001092B77D|nr:RIP metalloprotease RseP [Paraburkholderia phenoliruptrix]TGP41798.1 RIP metalloprotease RseP [bacterium M00.F.Ca.ET.228.01.1.1]TGR98589.1 RIP metalloprotease RseP [bacterium M00.F.Ca.ET.191.01.1.1]TGU02924.1 RIP metalloprotease RseP [bacterium M00.F.Ca.ET.155.01.1.1]MBW0447819.1 RIP metalloprotease RseP [Paraburkholderia phenoliruptrix]MBW9098399.1 RIP metalloprotease RseP [Paraburkholderia phenoliruptrix]